MCHGVQEDLAQCSQDVPGRVNNSESVASLVWCMGLVSVSLVTVKKKKKYSFEILLYCIIRPRDKIMPPLNRKLLCLVVALSYH